MRLKCLVEAFNALTDFFGSNGAPDTFTKCYQNSNKDAIFKATLLPKKCISFIPIWGLTQRLIMIWFQNLYKLFQWFPFLFFWNLTKKKRRRRTTKPAISISRRKRSQHSFDSNSTKTCFVFLHASQHYSIPKPSAFEIAIVSFCLRTFRFL